MFSSQILRNSPNRLLTVLIVLLLCGAAAAENPIEPAHQPASATVIQEAAQAQIRKNQEVGQALLALAGRQIAAASLKINPAHTTDPLAPEYFMPDGHDNTSAAETIHLLGALRDEQAIPFLLDHIDFQDFSVSTEHSLQGHCPCLGALIKIGAPAFTQMTEHIAVPGSKVRDLEVVQRLAGITMISVIGKSAAIAYVQARIRERKEAAQQQRLTDWLGIIQTLSDGTVN